MVLRQILPVYVVFASALTRQFGSSTPAHGREGETPEIRTLFFRSARLMSVPFLPLFIFDGPKRPKVKRGKKISGEKHWLVDSMKGMIEAFGFEWRMVRPNSPLLVDVLLIAFRRPLERRKQSWRT